MRYAVVERGGKQYIAREGEAIDVDRMTLDVGEEVEFERVLLTSDGSEVHVGAPHIKGAKVRGRVVDQVKGPKVLVLKYKPKIRYRRKQGHRQKYTRISIEDLVLPGETKAPAKAKAEAPKKATKKRSKAAAEKKAARTGEKAESKPKAAQKKATKGKSAAKAKEGSKAKPKRTADKKGSAGDKKAGSGKGGAQAKKKKADSD